MAAIGSTKCTYTPTNQWNGCRNMSSRHYWRKIKFICPFVYSTHHFPRTVVHDGPFQDTERPPINPPLHGGKWWWWKRLWTLPPISCGSLGWYKPMWTMCNLEWFEIGQLLSPLNLEWFEIGQQRQRAPTICARLVCNKYFFFANPKHHPCTGVGCQATDLYRGVVARFCEKKVFIAHQTCTNCWRITPISTSLEGQPKHACNAENGRPRV
jgi:hypothetical protein